MIQVKNLTKRYGSKTVVNNVSFTIEKGEIVGFLGPNGAGKTTTMNMITGYTSFTSGSVSVDGHDILEEPDEAKKNIGYLPEFPPLYPDMTVGEYLNFVFDLKKCKFDRDVHLAQVLAATKLADTEKRLIRNLSKGYRQRVGLAQALIGNPEILIFDEPTVGLDPREIKEIRNLIRALGESHTVILSSHILSEIQAVCGRVLVINDGYLVKDSPTDELLNISASSDRYAIRLAALIRLAYFNVTEEARQETETTCRKEYVGLPVTSSALIFPTFMLVRYILSIFCKGVDITLVYFLLLLATGVGFIAPFKMKKPGLKGILIMVGVGLAEFITFLVLFRIHGVQ